MIDYFPRVYNQPKRGGINPQRERLLPMNPHISGNFQQTSTTLETLEIEHQTLFEEFANNTEHSRFFSQFVSSNGVDLEELYSALSRNSTLKKTFNQKDINRLKHMTLLILWSKALESGNITSMDTRRNQARAAFQRVAPDEDLKAIQKTLSQKHSEIREKTLFNTPTIKTPPGFKLKASTYRNGFTR